MAIVGGHDFGKRLCAILGIDPAGTGCITITVAAGEVVTATVTRYVTQHQSEQVEQLLRECPPAVETVDEPQRVNFREFL